MGAAAVPLVPRCRRPWSPTLLGLVLSLLVIGLAMSALLAFGTVFLQSYFYTEADPGALWRAPIAGTVLTLFFFYWCWLNVNDARATPAYLPYDVVHRFSPELKLTKDPVKKLWTVRQGGEKQEYQAFKVPVGVGHSVTRYHQLGQTGQKGPLWNDSKLEAVIIEHDGQTYRFEPRAGGEGDYRYLVSPEGWSMPLYDSGLTGAPYMFSFGLFAVNVFLNFFHLVLWFVLLWLLLRFQWSHALGLAVVIWAVMTLLVLPGLLTQAGALAAPLPA